MQRWNDHIRPHKGFTELDKQAHKMFYAYVLGKLEEERNPLDWPLLIEGAIFEFFRRILLTDIKPVIFHSLMEKRGNELNRLVMDNMEKKGVFSIKNGLKERMEKYLFDPEYGAHEKRILKAAHYLATNWEFQIVYRLSSNFYGLEETKRSIDAQIAEFKDIDCVQRLMFNNDIKEFLNLIGQLRFQQRWAQTPRVPETSVAGHTLIVAILSYMVTLEMEACDRRRYNAFFAGLFHDLPEVLTRDIISPVKSSVDGLGDLIKGIEEAQMEEVIYPMLPVKWSWEIKYFTENEFDSRIMVDGHIRKVDSEEISEKYNQDALSPIDGQIIEFCDKFAAYMEAYLSIKHGITSRNLEEGHKHIYDSFADFKVADQNLGMLLDYFKL